MATTPRRANYALAVTKAMLTFAVKRGLRPNNPAVGIALYRENRRERFLSEAEIGAASQWNNDSREKRENWPFAAGGLRLALFTGARSGEVTAFRWGLRSDWEQRLIRLPYGETEQAEDPSI